MFDVVDYIVALGYFNVGGDFDMRNDKAMIFAVAVYDKVMYADYAVVG